MNLTANSIAKRHQDRARRESSFVAALITIGLIAAGCGTSLPSHSETPRTVAAIEFSKCMRAHGLPDFPDPGSNISGADNSEGGIEIPATIDTQSPAFQDAQSACRGLLSAATSSQGKPAITASLKASLIAHAQCMRTHGVPDYQDPTFPVTGGIAITDAGTNPQSPAYQHAAAVCASR